MLENLNINKLVAKSYFKFPYKQTGYNAPRVQFIARASPANDSTVEPVHHEYTMYNYIIVREQHV